MSFEITRTDGRSNQQVVIDYVAGKSPGDVFTFEELQEELARRSEREYDRAAVCAAVNQANRRLLREFQRCLHNVRGRGYRLAPAKEHIVLAAGDRRRAHRSQLKGLEKLRNVRWDEMDENARNATQGTLMLMEAFAGNQRALESRVARVEEAIRNLHRPGDDS